MTGLLLSAIAHASTPRVHKHAPPRRDETAAVRVAFEKLVRAFKDRDAQAAMAQFAADALLSYPGLPDKGYREIGEAFRKRFAQPPDPALTVELDAKVEEVQVSGDMAFLRVTWTVKWSRQNPDRRGVSQERDLEIWRRQKSGGWKLARGLSYPVSAAEGLSDKKE